MQSTTHALHYLSTIIYMLFFNIVHITDKFEYVHDFIFTEDARVKSLKPRCACTGVVLWLSDPPDMSIKVERQLHDMRILGRIVGVRSTEQFVRHLLTPTSYRIVYSIFSGTSASTFTSPFSRVTCTVIFPFTEL